MSDLDHTFTGDDDDPWDPAVFPIIDSYLGTSPDPTIQGNRGVMVTGGTGLGIGDRHSIIAYTADTYTDTEIIVQMEQSTVLGGYAAIGWRVVSWSGSGNPANGYEAQWDINDNNVNVFNNATGLVVAYARDLTNLDPADVNWWRVYSRGDRHKIKWWAVGDTEPPTWSIDFTDATHAGPGRTYLSAVNTDVGVAVTVVWDDLHVGEILPPPPGIRIGTSVALLEALYIGDHDPVTAAYLGDVEIPVPA
jgi:hypothetical protein